MTFTSPTWLWALLPVAAAAMWAMFRPSRKLTYVGSVSLWQEALAAVPPAARRARRVSWSWLLLLAGAAAAAVALAGPVLRREAPRRHVAIAVRPSVELGNLDELRQAAGAMLDRLDAADRVQLLLPVVAGGAGEWLSPAAARERIEGLNGLWAPAAQLDLPAASADAQHTWIFTVPGAGDAAGPNVTVVPLPARLRAVTIDAVSAVPEGQGRARVFAAVRNQTDQPKEHQDVGFTVTPDVPKDASAPPEMIMGSFDLGPHERRSVSLSVPGLAVIHITGTSLGEQAWLVRRERPRAKVALTGPDEPLLRRFIRVSPGLELTGSPGDADVIFANAPGPGEISAGKPTLVIDPQGAAGAVGGWSRTDASETVVSPAIAAPQDPVVRDVSLEGAAVRRVRPWVRQRDIPAAALELARGGAGAVLLRSDTSSEAAVGGPRRVYIAFDLGADNAHFDRPEMLPILLANATAWLLGDRAGTATYEAVTPMQAGPGAERAGGWNRVADGKRGIRVAGAGDWPAPGLYVDRERGLHAVNLTGLVAQPAPADPLEALARSPLPEPRPSRRDVPLWPAMALAAMALWLAGWAARGA